MSGRNVAIILINWNSYEFTNDCIYSLIQTSYPHFDIIVVDNNSQDGSAAKLRSEHPRIILLEASENLGFAGGNNLAIDFAVHNGYEYVLLLNNDTIVEPDFLKHRACYMDKHPEAGAIQPRIYFNHDRTLLWNGGSSYNRWTGFTTSRRFNKKSNASTEHVRRVDWLTGCCILTRTSIIKQVGALNEKFFMYYEDVDFSFRVKQVGYQLIYLPQSIIFHIAGGSGKLKTKGREGYVHPLIYYYSLRNKIWILKKYVRLYEWPSVFMTNFFYYGAVLGYFLLRGRFVKLKATINAIFAGVKGRID